MTNKEQGEREGFVVSFCVILVAQQHQLRDARLRRAWLMGRSTDYSIKKQQRWVKRSSCTGQNCYPSPQHTAKHSKDNHGPRHLSQTAEHKSL